MYVKNLVWPTLFVTAYVDILEWGQLKKVGWTLVATRQIMDDTLNNMAHQFEWHIEWDTYIIISSLCNGAHQAWGS